MKFYNFSKIFSIRYNCILVKGKFVMDKCIQFFFFKFSIYKIKFIQERVSTVTTAATIRRYLTDNEDFCVLRSFKF